jgi:hypothetical protein
VAAALDKTALECSERALDPLTAVSPDGLFDVLRLAEEQPGASRKTEKHQVCRNGRAQRRGNSGCVHRALARWLRNIAEGLTAWLEIESVSKIPIGMEREQDVCPTRPDEGTDEPGLGGLVRRAGDRLRDLEMADHDTAALRHPVRFGNEHRITEAQCRLGKELGYKENTLPPYSADDDLLILDFTHLRPPILDQRSTSVPALSNAP